MDSAELEVSPTQEADMLEETRLMLVGWLLGEGTSRKVGHAESQGIEGYGETVWYEAFEGMHCSGCAWPM